MTTQIAAAMAAPDMATQAELDAAYAAALAAAALKKTGDTVQIVATQTGAVATGTAIIPADDTIPQITEGTEVMTASITPTSASNYLQIDVVVNGACAGSANELMCAALFQDSAANALACGFTYMAANVAGQITFRHRMLAGTTSPTTMRVRFGGGTANTFTFNGTGGVRAYGGAMASSITITEIKA